MGIFSFGSSCRMARISRLSSGLPGTIAGPDLPPARILSRESSCKPPSFESVWQAKHCVAKTGRTRSSKNSLASGEDWAEAVTASSKNTQTVS